MKDCLCGALDQHHQKCMCPNQIVCQGKQVDLYTYVILYTICGVLFRWSVTRGRPEVFLEPEYKDERLELSPGDSVNLTCNGVGYPPPRVIWFRNSVPMLQEKEVQEGGVTKIATLKTVVMPQLFQSATFTCIAENDYGDSSVSVDIMVKGNNNNFKIPRTY